MSRVKSWDSLRSIDCFGNGNPSTIDHIWPISLEGSKTNKKNLMRLSLKTNELMANKTKGRIGSYRWSKVKAVSKNGAIYGILRIRHDSVEDKTNWTTVFAIL